MAKLDRVKNELRQHWNTPDIENGKYVSWREHLDLFLGVGMNYASQSPLGFLSFSVSCFMFIYFYKLPYLSFTVIGLIGMPLSYLWNILGWIVADNLGFLPRKTEMKFYIFYAAVTAAGLAMIIFDTSTLFSKTGWVIETLNGIEGISARSFFKIFGTQLFINAFGGARAIFWRKKLVPKYGRYKFSLYCNVFQKCVCVILIGWLPLYNVTDVDERVWMVYLLFSLFNMYEFTNKLEDISTVISPNSKERLWVRTYTIKLCHVFNSIIAAIIPVCGKFDNINMYRWVIPGFVIPCVVLTMMGASRITERIPQPPIEKKQQVPFWYGVFQVMRNKYNWINMSSSIIDSLGNGCLSIMTFVYLYSLRFTGGLGYSLLTLLYTSRTTLATFFAPVVIPRFSYKSMRLFKQIVEIVTGIVSVMALWLCGERTILCGIIFYTMQYIRGFVIQLPQIAISDMDVRLKDYQMYLSGERLENLTNVFGWFSSPITTMVGLIIPILLLQYGYNSVWDVVLIESARFKIFAIPTIIDLVGHILMIIPYLFWDYNNEQHEYVIEVLKQRAELAKEDYYPSTYEGGLDFENPGKLKNGIPEDLSKFVPVKRNIKEKLTQ